MISASAIYEGTVTHRRHGPVEHHLSYPVFMPLLDLDELPEALDAHPLWSARRPAPVRFRARDFLTEAGPGGGPPGAPAELADAARALARDEAGDALDGPVRLLASPRFLGVGFNPVSFLFLHDNSGESLRAVIAEVTNTPWGERHPYVVRRGANEHGPITARFAKRLHVSPFHPMNQAYEIRVGDPGASLGITIASEQEGRTVFEATLALRRRELSRSEMTRMIRSYPPATIATLARIYWQGLRLRLKGAPSHPKPEAGTGCPALRPSPD